MKNETKPTQEEKAMATELMIGNFIKVNRFNIDIPATIENFDDLHQISTGQLKVKGELLTEKWLEDLGFSKGEKTVQEGQSFNIDIGADRKLHINALNYNPHAWIRDYFTQSTLDDFIFLCHPKYVHQLQNLYSCLTGLKLRQKGESDAS